MTIKDMLQDTELKENLVLEWFTEYLQLKEKDSEKKTILAELNSTDSNFIEIISKYIDKKELEEFFTNKLRNYLKEN